MPLYESVFIARQDISGAQVEALTEQFSQIIIDQGGTVTKKEYWGLKNLTYRIKKNRKGHYTLLNIDASSPALLEMERNMGLNEDVLRYMSVRVEALDEGPSAMMLNKGDRGRRRDGEEGGEDRPERFERRPREDRMEGGME
ncbi:MAG: 30S ribosomal protein S6 [Elsteraceae bacterium]